jgi:hypothetical protein
MVLPVVWVAPRPKPGYDNRHESLLTQPAFNRFAFDLACSVRNNRIVVPRPKAGRDAGFESQNRVAALARLRDPGDWVVVGPGQCLATDHPRVLCWVCSR